MSCALHGEAVSPSILADPRTGGLDLKASILLRPQHLASVGPATVTLIVLIPP
jgi:hypothetical protein